MSASDMSTTTLANDDAGLWNEPQTAKYLGVALRYLQKLRAAGDGPPHIRLPGGRWGLIRYDPDEVRAWTRRLAEERAQH